MFSYKDLFKSWNNFFFEPRPTEGVAFFSIVWCSILLATLLFDVQNINDFYGPHGLLSLNTVREQFPYIHMNIFHMFNPSYEVTAGIMGLYALALVTSILGFYTRTSLIIVLVCITSLHQRNIWLLSSSELLLRSITIFLICAPAGHSLSLDSLLGRKFAQFRKPRDWAPWALRLIQIQVSVIYLWTVWHKLKGDSWFDGTALYYATRLDDMTNFPVPFLLDSMVFIKMATWGTLLIEIALGTLVWIKECRKPVIMVGLIFHLGIEYMMSIPFFEFIMMALLLNFFTPEEYRAFFVSARARLFEGLKASEIHPSVKKGLLWAVKGANE